jgi:hypothetical protein
MKKNYLNTASRSAYLAEAETNGKGVRAGVEREQVTAAGIVAGYPLDTFSLTKVEAFEQREGMPITVEALAKALVVTDAPWSSGLPYSVDVFFPTDDPSAPLWVGWVEGATIEVGPFDANGYATLIAMVDDGETVTFGYDRSLEWYVPVESAAFAKFASKPRSRDTAA